jgi:hypothetical protein
MEYEVVWMELTHNKVQKWDFLKTVLSLLVRERRDFLTGRVRINFRRTLNHEISIYHPTTSCKHGEICLK